MWGMIPVVFKNQNIFYHYASTSYIFIPQQQLQNDTVMIQNMLQGFCAASTPYGTWRA
jgi:hypothetical protein